MGFLDFLLGEHKPNEELHEHHRPFTIAMKFIPRRLTAHKESRMDLEVKVTNNAKDTQLVSVDALLPRKVLLGFDPTCINKHVEKKLGEVEAGETKEFHIRIWSSNQTKGGEYPIEIRVHSHYLDYTKVLNHVKKRKVVRVV